MIIIYIFAEEHDFYCGTGRNEMNMMLEIFTDIETRQIIDQADYQKDIVVSLVIIIDTQIIITIFIDTVVVFLSTILQSCYKSSVLFFLLLTPLSFHRFK